MNTQRERMWSAYLDGELSASEAAEFDQSLSPEQKNRLQAEVRFECALGDALGRGGACPEDVWSRTLEKVQELGGRPVRRVPVWQRGIYALAAVLMLAFAGVVYQAYFSEPSFLKLKDRSVRELVAKADYQVQDLATTNDYLHSHGVDLSLVSIEGTKPKGHHSQELLGIKEQKYRGVAVEELLYECCGKPVKVVIAPKGSRAATAVLKAIDVGAVQELRTVGDYVAATVGTHPAPGLLDLLSDDPDNATRRI